MAVLVQTFQAALPLELLVRLQRIRHRYAQVLQAAGRGDLSHERELSRLGRLLGHILAAEARKTPAERGGMRMLDLSLAVDAYFPELRTWNQQAALRYRTARSVAQ